MKLSQQPIPNGYIIRSCAPGSITIASPGHQRSGVQQDLMDMNHPLQVQSNEETLQKSIIITPQRLFRWPPQRFEELQLAHLEVLASLQPEVLIVGTGQTTHFPEPAWVAWSLKQGFGFELMVTAAACRTYNILVADERKVVAALINA